MAELLVGIDVGTGSTKGVLTRLDGTVVAQARVDHQMTIPRPGWAEQDADAIWWADFVEVSRQLVAQLPPGDTIAAVACSAIGPTLLPLDEAGRPLRPGILYGVDTRAGDQVAKLEAEHGADEVAAFAGHRLSSQSIGPKIRWLRECEPEIYGRARWFVTASSYLVFRLTAALAIDAHTASHWDPLFDPQRVAWSDRYATGITDLDQLPEIRWPADVAGRVTDAAASQTGLPAGVPVAVGTVDVAAEALGVGAVDDGDLMLMYGSTTFLLLVSDRPRPADPLWLVAGLERGRWSLAAGLATGGSAMTWFRDRFAQELVLAEAAGGPEALSVLAEEAHAADGGNDVLFLPYLSGERTPINDPAARGVMAGLSLHATRGDIYRGLLNGIAYAVRHNIEAMGQLGAVVRRVVAVGGGTADLGFVQLVSDVSGIDQDLPASRVGAARGDAILAGRAAGLLDGGQLASWTRIERTIRPDAGRRGGHDARYALFHELYLQTRSTVHALQ